MSFENGSGAAIDATAGWMLDGSLLQRLKFPSFINHAIMKDGIIRVLNDYVLFVLWEIYIIYVACKVIRYLLMSYESCIHE